MSTLADIRDYVREQTLIEIDDWDSTKINNVINEGVYEVATRFKWPWLAGSGTLGVTAGTQEYAFTTFASGSDEVASIQAIIDQDRRIKLNELGSNEAFQRFGGDMPEAPNATEFYIWGDTINLIPVPDTTEAAAYKVYYYKKPTLLTSDVAEPQWDKQFHLVLAQWAIARVWEREEDYEKGAAWQGKFDAQVERMARHYLDRASNVPSIVGLGRSPRRSGGGGTNTPFLN